MGHVQVPCLTVACVNWKNFAGHGRRYVENLFSGVDQYLDDDWHGVCLTDDAASVPGGIEARILPGDTYGWWNKLYLFAPGAFPDGTPVLYLDLDTVIIDCLDEIAGYRGDFAGMTNFDTGGLASGVMAFEAGRMNHVWDIWETHWRPAMPSGDQQWIETVNPSFDRLQDLYPGQLASYKLDCQGRTGAPENSRVVYFHGRPRPHQAVEPWIKAAWNARS